MDTNRQYKNSVFTYLFSNPNLLRELYCAIEGVTLPADIPVTINTLSDVLFMDKVNDISFEIGGKLIIIMEHQSTINPNMALRLLLYIGRIYEKIIQDKRIYSSKKILVPQPEFFVLYNGLDPYPDEELLKLSSSFESAVSLGLSEAGEPSLELEVKVININEGKNNAIARRCRTLAQYSAFIAKVRECEKEGYSRSEAVRKAVIYCRSRDILKEFLEQNAHEVMNMLITEWNWDDAKEVWQEEAREEGRKEGLEKGREEKRTIARNLLANGSEPEFVSEITGFSLEEIEKL